MNKINETEKEKRTRQKKKLKRTKTMRKKSVVKYLPYPVTLSTGVPGFLGTHRFSLFLEGTNQFYPKTKKINHCEPIN